MSNGPADSFFEPATLTELAISGYTPVEQTRRFEETGTIFQEAVHAAHNWQQLELSGFTSKELVDADAWLQNQYDSPILVDNGPIHPVFGYDRWPVNPYYRIRSNPPGDLRNGPYTYEIGRPAMPLDGTTRRGEWTVEDANVRRALEPCLRLASRILLSPSTIIFLDALAQGDREVIDLTEDGYTQNHQPPLKHTPRRFKLRTPSARNSDAPRHKIHTRLESLANFVRFDFFRPGWQFFRNTPVGDELSVFTPDIPAATVFEDRDKDKPVICLNSSIFHPLLTASPLKVPERLALQAQVAISLVHELAHSLHARLHGNDPEPYYVNDIMNEVGFALEQAIFGGVALCHPRLPPEPDVISRGAMAMLLTEWPDTSPDDPPKNRFIGRRPIFDKTWPVPLEFLEDIHNPDFWSVFHGRYASETLRLAPGVVGKTHYRQQEGTRLRRRMYSTFGDLDLVGGAYKDLGTNLKLNPRILWFAERRRRALERYKGALIDPQSAEIAWLTYCGYVELRAIMLNKSLDATSQKNAKLEVGQRLLDLFDQDAGTFTRKVDELEQRHKDGNFDTPDYRKQWSSLMQSFYLMRNCMSVELSKRTFFPITSQDNDIRSIATQARDKFIAVQDGAFGKLKAIPPALGGLSKGFILWEQAKSEFLERKYVGCRGTCEILLKEFLDEETIYGIRVPILWAATDRRCKTPRKNTADIELGVRHALQNLGQINQNNLPKYLSSEEVRFWTKFGKEELAAVRIMLANPDLTAPQGPEELALFDDEGLTALARRDFHLEIFWPSDDDDPNVSETDLSFEGTATNAHVRDEVYRVIRQMIEDDDDWQNNLMGCDRKPNVEDVELWIRPHEQPPNRTYTVAYPFVYEDAEIPVKFFPEWNRRNGEAIDAIVSYPDTSISSSGSRRILSSPPRGGGDGNGNDYDDPEPWDGGDDDDRILSSPPRDDDSDEDNEEDPFFSPDPDNTYVPGQQFGAAPPFPGNQPYH